MDTAYKTRTICELTGFSPALLRAWERRHGLLRPQRTSGGHRLYTADDLRVLQRIKVLLAEGRSIGELAAWGREALLAGPGPAPAQGEEGGERRSAWVQDVVRCAQLLDGPGLDRVLDEAFGRLTPAATITGVLEPALHELGERWSRGELSVASEHLASAKVQVRLQRLLDSSLQHDPGAPLALCSCLPGERHQLGLLVVAYWLCGQGYRVAYLGADLPLADLERACAELQPHDVLLSATRPEVLEACKPALRGLLRRQTPRFHIGGQGVTGPDPELERAGARLALGEHSLADLRHPGRT